MDCVSVWPAAVRRTVYVPGGTAWVARDTFGAVRPLAPMMMSSVNGGGTRNFASFVRSVCRSHQTRLTPAFCEPVILRTTAPVASAISIFTLSFASALSQ